MNRHTLKEILNSVTQAGKHMMLDGKLELQERINVENII